MAFLIYLAVTGLLTSIGGLLGREAAPNATGQSIGNMVGMGLAIYLILFRI